jgi:hypothetical protein
MERLKHTSRSTQATAVLAIVTWIAVLTPFALSVVDDVETLSDFLELLVSYTAFFTILTNTGVALALTAPLLAPESRVGRFFRRPGVVTGLAASITLVSLTYELLLRTTYSPDGLIFFVDLFLHDLIPISFVLYWWYLSPKGSLSWRDPLAWAVYLVAYAVYTLARGLVLDTYPYPFMDVNELGYGWVMVNMLGILLVYLALSAGYVALARYHTSGRAVG